MRTKVLLLILLWLGATALHSQHIQEELWITDGPVNVVDKTDSTVYIGGDFSYVGPATGGWVPIVDSSVASTLSFPSIEAVIKCAVSDGKGGYYVAGARDINETRGIPGNGIIHILPDFSIDENWRVNSPYLLHSLLLRGDTLFMGSDRVVKALRVSTQELLDWNVTSNGSINSLVQHNDELYIGGYFSYINGKRRDGLAIVDAKDGSLKNFSPVIQGRNRQVNCLNLAGDTLFVAGQFDEVDGRSIANLFALNITDHSLLDWAPISSVDGHNNNIRTIAVDDSLIYLGGQFYNLNGIEGNSCFATLPRYEGQETPLFLNTFNKFTTNQSVNAIYITDQEIYLGGNFITNGDYPKHNFAVISKGTQQVTDQRFDTSYGINVIIAQNDQLAIGGGFQSAGGKIRNNVAALNARTGNILPWNPDVNGPVHTIASDTEYTYIGGAFTQVSGNENKCFAEVDKHSGYPSEVSINVVSRRGFNNVVNSLKVYGDTLYIGGELAIKTNGQTKNLITYNLRERTFLDWDVYLSGGIYDLERHHDVVYVTGEILGRGEDKFFIGVDAHDPTNFVLETRLAFKPKRILVKNDKAYVGGEASYGLDALVYVDLTNGQVHSLNDFEGKNTYQSPYVSTLAANGNHLFVGGYFSEIDGNELTDIASIDLINSRPTDWNFGNFTYERPIYTSENVRSILIDGRDMYVGGSFTYMGGQERTGIVCYKNLVKYDQTLTPPLVHGIYPMDTVIYLKANSSSELPVSVSLLEGEEVAAIDGDSLSIHGGGRIQIRWSQGGDTQYNAAKNIVKTIVVHKDHQDIVFSPVQNQVYSDTSFHLSAYSTSGLGVRFEAATGGEFINIQDSTVAIKGAGQVVVHAIQPGNFRYDPADTIVRTFSIWKATQRVTMEPIANQFLGADPVTLRSGVTSGLTVDYAAQGPVSIVGDKIILLDTGLVTVTATQSGDQNFTPAQDQQTFYVYQQKQPSDSLGQVLLSLKIQITADSAQYLSSFTAELYQKLEGQFRKISDKEINDASYAVFEKLLEGEYTVRVNSLSRLYLPSYIGDTYILTKAKNIALSQDTSQRISLIRHPDELKGDATLSGKLFQGMNAENGGGRIVTGEPNAYGEPLGKAAVFLVHPTTHTVIAYDLTDNLGGFNFTQVPSGKYLLLADYQGIENDLKKNIIHIASDEELEVIVVAENQIQIVRRETLNFVTEISKAQGIQTLNYYPNPVSDALRIDHSVKWLGGTIDVVNALGEIIETQPITKRSSNVYFDRHNAGLYVIVITRNEQRMSFRVLRQ